MFIIRLFLGGSISCCWHFRAGGNCSGTDGDKEAVAEAMQQQRGKLTQVPANKGTKESRGSDCRAVQQYKYVVLIGLKK
jgi:hypothetical protein